MEDVQLDREDEQFNAFDERVRAKRRRCRSRVRPSGITHLAGRNHAINYPEVTP